MEQFQFMEKFQKMHYINNITRNKKFHLLPRKVMFVLDQQER